MKIKLPGLVKTTLIALGGGLGILGLALGVDFVGKTMLKNEITKEYNIPPSKLANYDAYELTRLRDSSEVAKILQPYNVPQQKISNVLSVFKH